MSILVILALLGVFGLSILFLFKNSKVVKVNKSEDESKEKHRQVPHEELEGEKFPFDLEEFAGFDKNTGRCSEDCLHLLEKRAKAHPSRVAYIWLDKEANEAGKVTYGQFHNIVSSFAKEKLQQYVDVADVSDERPKAMIILPPSLEYSVAFFSLLWSRFVPIPVYPPKDFAKESKRVTEIGKSAGAKFIISQKALYYKIMAASMFMGEFNPRDYTWIFIDDIETMKKKYTQSYPAPKIEVDMLAYLQYTSGSTSAPKGVRITHRNIMAQHFVMLHQFAPMAPGKLGPKVPFSHHFTNVFWVPPFHDFGLLTGLLSIGYFGSTNILYSALDFIANPTNWLISLWKYGPQFTVSPNFGYNLINALPEATRKRYPIPLHVALVSGAEPINPRTMKKLIETYNLVNIACGYGLAEFTLAFCAQKDGHFTTVVLDKKKFEQKIVCPIEDPKEIAKCNPEDVIEIVSCGPPAHECKGVIVDPETLQELPPGKVGELLLWDKVGNVAAGYYKNKEATEATFNAYYTDLNGKKTDHPWLRTGDLCFFHNGGTYICGRSKDLIIICGRNIYPHDVEAAVIESKPELICKGGAIAFSLTHYKGVDEEQLAIIAEINDEARKNPACFPEIYQAILEHVNDKFHCRPAYIVLMKENDLPRTASHKVSRAPCKKLLVEKSLPIIDAWPTKNSVL